MPLPQGNPKQVDVSTIPPAVRRMAEEAERLQRESIAANTPQEPAQPETPPAPTNPEPEQGNAPAGSSAENGGSEHPAPQATGTETETRLTEDPNDQSWKHRFESERGRTEKLRRDVATMADELTNLRNLMATMQAPAPASPQEMRFERLITPQEEETWGPEFMQVVEKKAKELIAPELAKINQQLEQLGGSVKQTTEVAKANAFQTMLRTLDGHASIGVQTPNSWRALNEQENFVEWLQYPDRLSGQKRHDMLKLAWNSNDASRVAAFFESFLREAGVVAPQAQPGMVAPSTPPKPSLDQFAAPGRAHTATPAPGAQAPKEIITRADITRFYADRQAGRFKTPEQKAAADAYEREIFAAQSEGRIKD